MYFFYCFFKQRATVYTRQSESEVTTLKLMFVEMTLQNKVEKEAPKAKLENTQQNVQPSTVTSFCCDLTPTQLSAAALK